MPPTAPPSAVEFAPNQSGVAVCAPEACAPAPPAPAPPPQAAAEKSQSPTSDTPAAEFVLPAVTPSAAQSSPAAPEYAAIGSHIRPPDKTQLAPARRTDPAKSACPSSRHCACQHSPQTHDAIADRPETAPPNVQFSRKSHRAADTAAAPEPHSTAAAQSSRPPPRAAHAAQSTGPDRGKGMRMTPSEINDTSDGITQQKSAPRAKIIGRKRRNRHPPSRCLWGTACRAAKSAGHILPGYLHPPSNINALKLARALLCDAYPKPE